MRTYDDVTVTDDYLESFHEDIKRLYKIYFDKLMKCGIEMISQDNLIIDIINKKNLKRRILITIIPEFANSREKYVEFFLNEEIISFLYDDKKYD